MKIIDDITTIFSHQVRSFWNVIQDIICLGICFLASSQSFPYYNRANNLFMFIMAITGLIFLYKIFRTDLYTNSVRTLGAWGARYRCFYAIYYPVMAFLCASSGGFKGYFFASIWIVSGGTYLIVADKIAKEKNVKKEEASKEIEKERKKIELGCPYCKSENYREKKVKNIKNTHKITNLCLKTDCGKEWTEVYEMVDIELNRKDIPANLKASMKVFE